ncbi:hypothetical protein TrVE_jg14319 [Triparma verrucosa]|uniref:WW domain-containing protein n=1 Tax=Triparma verrucosa TaxID=1606542 RepID=A0A9W7BV62_9STRA|nr:hypothetical protein TrVE_jg14319 [Triparma verrucosa]
MLCKLFSIILLACALSTVVDGSAEKPRIRVGGARPAQRLDCFTKPNSPGGVREDLEDLGEECRPFPSDETYTKISVDDVEWQGEPPTKEEYMSEFQVADLEEHIRDRLRESITESLMGDLKATHIRDLYDTLLAKKHRELGLEPPDPEARRLADGEGDFATLNRLLNKVDIVIPDPDPIFAVNLDEATNIDIFGGFSVLSLSVWAEVKNIILSRIQIENIKFDYTKPADDSYVTIDITLEGVALVADLDWAYWFCDCYKGKECSEDTGDDAFDCSLCSYDWGPVSDYRKLPCFTDSSSDVGKRDWTKNEGCCGDQNTECTPFPGGTDSCTKGNTYTDGEYKTKCAVKSTETWLNLKPGDGSANGVTTGSFMFQRFRFYPQYEEQELYLGAVQEGSSYSIKIIYDNSETHEGGSRQETAPITLAAKSDDFIALLKNEIAKLSNLGAEVQFLEIGHTGTDGAADGRYWVRLKSDGTMYQGAKKKNNGLPLFEVQSSATHMRQYAVRTKESNTLARGPPIENKPMPCPSDFTNANTADNACVNVVFDDLEFSGGLTATVATWIEPVIKGLLETVVETVVLQDLVINDLLLKLLNELMNDDLNKIFEPWIAGTEAGKSYNALAEQPRMMEKLAEMDGYNALEQPKHKVPLFNFTDPNNVYMNYVTSAVDGLINYEKDDNGDPINGYPVTKEDIKLNDIMESVASNSSAGLVYIKDMDITLMNGTDKFTKHHLQLTGLSIGGLNTFTLANVLNPIDDFTIENVVKLEKLSVEFDMKLELWPSTLGETVAASTNDLVTEEFHIGAMMLHDVTIDLKMLAAIDEYIAAALKAGSIFDNPVGCLPQAFHALNITYFNITAGSITEPVIADGDIIDGGTSIILNALSEFVFDSYGDMITWLLPEMAQTTVRNMLQGILESYIAEADTVCADPVASEDYVNFQTETLVQTGLKLLEDYLTEPDNTREDPYEKVNDLIRSVTDEGSFNLMDDFIYENVVPLGPGSELGIDMALFQVKIHNLDTVSKFEILNPIKPFSMRNEIDMGKQPFEDVQVEVHFNMTFSKNPNWDGNPEQRFVTNDFVLRLNMDHIRFVYTMVLQMNKQRVKSIKLRELQTFTCWYGTLDKAEIEAFAILFTQLLIGFECKTCTSPGFQLAEARSGEQKTIDEMTDGINRLLKKFTTTLMGSESTATLMRMAEEGNWVCECHTNPDITAEGPAGTQGGAARFGHSKTGKQYEDVATCIEDVEIGYTVDNSVELSFPTDLMFAFGSLIALIIYRSCIWPLIAKCIDCSRGETRRQYFAQKKEALLEKKEEFNMYKADASLAFHPAVAPWMKISVPICLFTCIGMFFMSHTSVLASIDIRITLGGDLLNFKEFQIMMLKESLEAMWEAQVWSLFIILFGFSFLWPYIKLIGLLLCWFLPPRIMATQKRGGFISLLDLLGKWSLIDIYVFVLTMSAFLMHIYSPSGMDPLLGDNFYQADLQVTPLFGLLASMIAGVLMPATNEVMIIGHRNAMSDTQERVYEEECRKAAHPSTIEGNAPAGMATIPEGGDRDSARESSMIISGENPMATAQGRSGRSSTWFEAGTDDVQGYRKKLVDTSYSLSHHVWENRGQPDRVALKRPGRWVVGTLCIFPAFVAFVGGLATSWSFDRDGLVGILIDAGDPGADNTDYSIWNVGLILIEKEITTKFLEVFTVYFCAVCCILFAFICPILQQIAMVYIWMKPMTLKQLKVWYFVVEVLSGWATMDVFIVSIMVCLLQIGMLSAFMIPPICDFLEPLVPYGFVEDKDACCFYVNAVVGPGTLLIFFAAVMSTFTLQFIQGAAQAAIVDRENRIKGIDMTADINLGVSSKFTGFMFRVMSRMFILDISRKDEFANVIVSERSAEMWHTCKKFVPCCRTKRRRHDDGEDSFDEEEAGEGEASGSEDEGSSDFDSSDSDFDDDTSKGSSFASAPPSEVKPKPRKKSSASRRSSATRQKAKSRASSGRRSSGGGSSFRSSEMSESSLVVAPPPRDGLPPGWTEQTTDNGTYYWNFNTGVTTWEKPKWEGNVQPPPPGGERGSEGGGEGIQMRALT